MPVDKKASKQTITAYQAFVLIYSTMFGVGSLSLSNDLANASKHNMIWIIFAAGLFIWFYVYCHTRLIQRFPGQTMVQFLPKVFGSNRFSTLGKILSFPILLAMGVYYVLVIAAATRIFSEAVVTNVLNQTPIGVLTISMMLMGAIASCNGLETIARINEFLIPFLFMPFFIMMIAMFQKGSITNLLPLFHMDWEQIFKGIVSAVFSYLGFSVFFMFAGYYQQPQKALKAHNFAMLAIIFTYSYICIATLSVFGPYELGNITYPTLEVAKVVNMPLLVFERFESFLLVLWLLKVFTTIINVYATIVQITIEYFGLKEKTRPWIAFSFLPLMYGLSTIPTTFAEILHFNRIISISGLCLGAVFILVLLIAVVRRKKGEAPSETTSRS